MEASNEWLKTSTVVNDSGAQVVRSLADIGWEGRAFVGVAEPGGTPNFGRHSSMLTSLGGSEGSSRSRLFSLIEAVKACVGGFGPCSSCDLRQTSAYAC